jgi:hypothetical protein
MAGWHYRSPMETERLMSRMPSWKREKTHSPEASGDYYGSVVGRAGWDTALKDRSARGNCDKLRDAAFRYAHDYTNTDPDLITLKHTMTHAQRSKLLGRLTHRMTETINGKMREIGCRPGKEIVVLPPEFRGYRKRLPGLATLEKLNRRSRRSW